MNKGVVRMLLGVIALARQGASFVSIGTPSRHNSESSCLFQATSSASRHNLQSLSPPQSQYGVGMDQSAMMESDLLVIVDENDQLLFHKETGPTNANKESSPAAVSKKVAHSFHPGQPRGICHRAFSLFVFDENENLLLTQRASSKITFPGVWTNTCCSHPLHGMTPNEVDHTSRSGEDDAYPSFDGIKHAAIRKAQHELGLTTLKHSDMTFVSRFHYWAADVQTHGPFTSWGEHEVDYILFCQLSQRPTLNLNPEEVAAIRYVSRSELQDMMNHGSDTDDTPTTMPTPTNGKYQWSPWFLGMMERGGMDWWKNLEGTLRGENTNRDIVFFDPHPDFMADYNLETHTRRTGVGLPEDSTGPSKS